jgi:plastocyanin domain-containing protein
MNNNRFYRTEKNGKFAPKTHLFCSQQSKKSAFLSVFSVGVLCVIGLSGCSNDKPVKATMNSEGTQQTVRVLVRNGYHPRLIDAKPGVPLKVEFYRDEPAGHSCDEELTIPSERITKLPLPPGKPRLVTLAARPKGSEVDFECGMQMLHGKVRYKL